MVVKRSTNLEAALELARKGYRVFPLYEIAKNGACSCRRKECGNAGKHPRTKNGVKDATSDPKKIRAWWTGHPNANIGIAAGNGLVIVDVDARHGGTQSLIELIGEYGELPDDRLVNTGSPGSKQYHLSTPDSTLIRNLTNVRPGIDLRSDNGYGIAPPSNHKSGGTYKWLSCEGDALPTLPELYLNLFAGPPKKPAKKRKAEASIDEDAPSLEELVSLANRLSPERCADHTDWIKVGMVFHLYFPGDDGLEEWDRWSQNAGNYESGVCEKRWRSFDQEREERVGIGTLRLWASEDDPGGEFDDVPIDDSVGPPSVASVDTPITLADFKVDKPWPSPLADCCFQNAIGEYVLANDPNTEADPIGVLMQLFEYFGCIIGQLLGKDARFRLNHATHYTNDYLLIIGGSGKEGRKGTSLSDAEAPVVRGGFGLFIPINRMPGASTGEAIIAALQDPDPEPAPDPEVKLSKRTKPRSSLRMLGDGRLMITATEFSRLQTCMKRETNTLSPVLRQAWDGRTLSLNTKNDPITSSMAHVSLIAHSTEAEFHAGTDNVQKLNGVLNRYQFCMVKASKSLPFPGQTADRHLEAVADAMIASRKWIDAADGGREFHLASSGRNLWRGFYDQSGKPTGDAILDAMCARDTSHVLRWAMRFAALECTAGIERRHLEPAIDIWRRCRESVVYMLGGASRSEALVIHDALSQAGKKGMSRTQISAMFHRHKSRDDITALLFILLREGLVRGITRKNKSHKLEMWYAR